jgi:PRC-barrel domain
VLPIGSATPIVSPYGKLWDIMGLFGRQWNTAGAAPVCDAPVLLGPLTLVKFKEWLPNAAPPRAKPREISLSARGGSGPTKKIENTREMFRSCGLLSLICPQFDRNTAAGGELSQGQEAGGPEHGSLPPERLIMEAPMLKKLALISAVSAFALGTALAQAPAPSTTPTSPPAATPDLPKADAPKADMKATTGTTGSAHFVAAQKPDQWIASKFKGTDVLGPDNQKVGDVSDILFDKDGTKIDAYVISVGGFLGMGSKHVALAPNDFQVVPGDPNSVTNNAPKLKISMTKEQLKDAPNFEPYKEPRATTGAGGAGGPGAPRPAPGGMNR